MDPQPTHTNSETPPFGPLDIILSSIGDGVIAADSDCRVTYLNHVAEELTGWSLTEAQGELLETVFPIVNEETHLKVENPAIRSLKEGAIFGLANHTLLISREGREIPIDDSAAPIKDKSGALVGAVLVFREITARRRAEKAQGLLAAIVDSADDAIVGKNLDGIIESWNAGAERLFEYSPSEAIGKSIRMIIPPDRYDEEEMLLKRLRRGERIQHFETVRLTKSGRAVDIDLSISPVRNTHAEIIGASKIARDISDRKQLEQQRLELLVKEQEARARSEAAHIAKDEFIAQVSHEMRTPLNSILGWTSVLQRVDYERDQTIRAVGSIERSARVQLQLIEDLIDLSKILKGKMKVQMQPIHITPIVEQALETIRPAAEAKEIRIESEIQTSNDLISGDPDRLLQVFWNLLSNAVKFTPAGGRVAVVVTRPDHHLKLTVSDSGVGLDPEFLPLIFDRFSQAGVTAAGRQDGLGLGLAIVRYFVELHGGGVIASSAGRGKGSTFTITLPTKQ
jgi:PAS domain S-box-containing protein